MRGNTMGSADTDLIPTQTTWRVLMASLTFALLVVCVAALAGESTRRLGLLCLGLLAVLHPILFTVLLLIAGGAFLYIHWRD